MHVDPWTIALQAVNFLVLAWLLRRFLYAPVLGVLGRRQEEIAARFASADAARVAAESERRSLADRLSALDAERRDLLAAARTAAAAEAAQLRSAAQGEADGIVATARAKIADERRSAEIEIRRSARSLAIAMARRMLGSVMTHLPIDAFVDSVLDELAEMSEERLRSLVRPGEVVEARTPQPASPALEAQVEAQLVGLMRVHAVQMRWAVDPDLLIGFELVFPRLAIRRSWADDLTRIMEELEHGDGVGRIARAVAE